MHTFLFGDDILQKSMIKLQRKDSNISAKYDIYDNRKFVGEISSDGILNWTRNPGYMQIHIKDKEGLSNIEMNIEPGKLYEIVFSDNSFEWEDSHIREADKQPDSNRIIVFSILGVIFLLLMISLIQILKNLKLNRALSFGIKLIETGEYQKAIEIFLKIIRNYPAHLEAMKQLEIAYVKSEELEKAFQIRKKIVAIFKEKKLYDQFAPGFTSAEINIPLMIECLNKNDFPVEKINIIRPLKKGFSGFPVYLTEVFFKDDSTTNFAVIKTETGKPGNFQNELQREFSGSKMFRKNWNKYENLPSKTLLLSEPELLIGASEANVLLSSFAEKEQTKNVFTLREGLNTKFTFYLPVISRIKNFYEEKFYSLKSENKKFLTPFEHLNNILDSKLEKIEKFDWEGFGIEKAKQFINIDGRLFPNILYYLFSGSEKFNQSAFSTFYYPIHGDMNLENIIIKSDGEFVLIDFDKTRESVFFYDLTFFICWTVQIFLLENSENESWELLLNLIPELIEFTGNPERNLDLTPNANNFSRILENIYPFRKKFSQNSLNGFLLCLCASSLLRSFYELRDCNKNDRNQKNRKNGIFFYALACRLFDNEDFLTKTKSTTKEAFDLPNP